MTDICSGCAVLAEQNIQHSSVPIQSFQQYSCSNYRINTSYLAIGPVRKPLQQRKDTDKRDLYWVHGRLNWCDGDWQHVVFSNESRLFLYRNDGRVLLLRQAAEALLDECVLPRVQAGGSGVTKYGVFYNRGKSELHLLDGNLDQYQYIRVLETKILPFTRRAFQTYFVPR
jgi:hypothetical protein